MNPLETPRALKFAHDFHGHRYIGVPGAGGGVPGAGGAEGSPVAGGAPLPGGVPAGPGAAGFVPAVPGIAGGPAAYLAASQQAAAQGGSDAPSGGQPPPPAGGLQFGAGDVIAPSGFSFRSQFRLPAVRPAALPAPQPASRGLFPVQARQPLDVTRSTDGRAPLTVRALREPLREGEPLTIRARGPELHPPITPVQHLDNEPCEACGQIRKQTEEVKQSLKFEQQQRQQQRLEQQQKRIEDIRQREKEPPPTDPAQIDRNIQEKIALLDELNRELAEQQAQQLQEIPPGAPVPAGLMPRGVPTLLEPGQHPTFGQLFSQNAGKFLTDVAEAGGCAKLLAKFGVPPLVSGALCLGYQQVKGDIAQLTKFVEEIAHYLEGGQPEHAPPPKPQQPVMVCMSCVSVEDAIRYQSGQPSECQVASVTEG